MPASPLRNWCAACTRDAITPRLRGLYIAGIGRPMQSARINDLDPWACLKDVLVRLPGHLNSGIDELLPHH